MLKEKQEAKEPFYVDGNAVIEMIELFSSHYAPIVYKSEKLRAVQDTLKAIIKQIKDMGEE